MLHEYSCHYFPLFGSLVFLQQKINKLFICFFKNLHPWGWCLWKHGYLLTKQTLLLCWRMDREGWDYEISVPPFTQAHWCSVHSQDVAIYSWNSGRFQIVFGSPSSQLRLHFSDSYIFFLLLKTVLPFFFFTHSSHFYEYASSKLSLLLL